MKDDERTKYRFIVEVEAPLRYGSGSIESALMTILNRYFFKVVSIKFLNENEVQK